jgi:hypothetical protein
MMRPESAEELYRQGRLSTEARTWLREYRPGAWRAMALASTGTTGEHRQIIHADSHGFTQAGGGGITGEYRVCPNRCYLAGTHCHCASPASNVDR